MTKKKNNRKTRNTLCLGKHLLYAHQLSFISDVLRNCLRYKCEAGRFADVNKMVKKAVLVVSGIWARAIGDWLTVSLLDQKVIQDKLERLYRKGLIVSTNKRYLTKLGEFKMEMNKFFDICGCMCPSASCFQVNCIAKNCDGFHLACKCEVKVPKREILFLLNKRGARKMVKCDIDKDVSKMWAERQQKTRPWRWLLKSKKVKLGSGRSKCSLVSLMTVLTMQATTTSKLNKYYI